MKLALTTTAIFLATFILTVLIGRAIEAKLIATVEDETSKTYHYDVYTVTYQL